MLLCIIIMVVIICVLCCSLFCAHTATTVEQIFPENVNYSCHSPNIKFKCTFSENPLAASWTIVFEGKVPEQITDSTPGHTVDESKKQSGSLFLLVEDTMYSANNIYICAAFYYNESIEASTPFPVPMVEG